MRREQSGENWIAHSFKPERMAGLALVVAIHATALWGLWQHRLIPNPQEAMILFANFIAPPPNKKEEPKRPPARQPKPIEKPQPRQIVTETPAVSPTDYAAPPPPQSAPPIEAPSAPPPKLAGPVTLGGELSVACPERRPPSYPRHSQRMGEEGAVVLRVELDEQGSVSAARVSTSSGFAQLDNAALAAVRTWRCNPPTRNGHPVRTVAMQPFNFILQGK